MTRQMKEGGPELPCMTRIKNESANIVNKNDDNERPFFLENYANCPFYDEIMLQ